MPPAREKRKDLQILSISAIVRPCRSRRGKREGKIYPLLFRRAKMRKGGDVGGKRNIGSMRCSRGGPARRQQGGGRKIYHSLSQSKERREKEGHFLLLHQSGPSEYREEDSSSPLFRAEEIEEGKKELDPLSLSSSLPPSYQEGRKKDISLLSFANEIIRRKE